MENPRVLASESTKTTDQKKVQADLKGNTLRAYVYLLKSHPKPVGVRKLQRALGFSSPNLSLYHLDKLVSLGLASSENGEYSLVRQVRLDVLQEFMKLGNFLLPRFVIYAVMFSVMLGYFAAQLSSLNLYAFWALIFGAAATVVSWYETFRAWRHMP